MTLPIAGDQTAASGPVPKDNANLVARIEQLEKRLAEQDRKTLYSASIAGGRLTIRGTGGIQVRDADDQESFFVGGAADPIYNRPDGQPQQQVLARDDAGQARFAVYDPYPLVDGYVQNVYIWDAAGNVAFVTDNNNGLARPWLSVPMYPLFSMPASTVYGYMNLTASTSERTLWEGRASISHPWLLFDGVWGQASGASLTNVYRLKVNGVQINSWTEVGGAVVGQRGPSDVRPYLGQDNVAVQLTLASSGSTGQVACQVLGCHLRQT